LKIKAIACEGRRFAFYSCRAVEKAANVSEQTEKKMAKIKKVSLIIITILYSEK
jgi:hypothetical protein